MSRRWEEDRRDNAPERRLESGGRTAAFRHSSIKAHANSGWRSIPAKALDYGAARRAGGAWLKKSAPRNYRGAQKFISDQMVSKFSASAPPG